MNSRMETILKQLMAAQIPITSEQLAAQIQVTSRTIRNDIKLLDELLRRHGAAVVSLKSKGYKLIVSDEGLFKQLLKHIVESEGKAVPVEPEDRVRFLVRKLLLQDQYIKLDDIADELFISRSTLQKDLRDVKVIIEKYGLSLQKKPNFGLKLEGAEVSIRFCMAEYLFDRTNEGADMKQSLPILASDEMDVIRESIIKKIKKYHVVLSDISLKNLMIHLAIACKRVREENYVRLVAGEMENIAQRKEFVIAKEIISAIEERLEVRFPEYEAGYAAMHLLGTRLLLTPSEAKKNIKKYIDPAIFSLAYKMVEEVDRKLDLGIREDKELIAALTLHLKPAIHRYKYKMNLRNPMLEAIKANYPLAFEAGVIAGRMIQSEIDIQIDDNEIGYLALHLGAAIERGKMTTKPKKCLVVCATGVGSTQLLYYKLRSHFGNELQIVGTTEYYNLKKHSLTDIDFVISTIPIADDLGVPSVVVSTILGGADLGKIRQLIRNSGGVVEKYLIEKYVFLQKSFPTREKVIEFLGKKLVEDEIVDKTFVQSVIDREAVSPTSFGNLVAIPHPMTPQTNKTFWAICTLKKPIDWGGKQVQLVCLLNINKNNNSDLKPMYEKLVSIVDDLQVVQQLVQCKSFNQLAALIKDKNN
ncbi:lichenan operon transcriptional antiterminator [Evansella caseinilytica]|uniref:Lichenan operon transcriptional antiterminator n=1 Tax=Evansella caseinilytica TaxID=1503961 RepID=A0A1H3UV91_9BACI|nr:BglG family transcription antiterminator [Evansella caseinilytica]SDZ65729.1 lichenan operon transcriptional antiterminator [Evansella caseinilytica]